MGYPHFSGDCVDYHDRVIDWGGHRAGDVRRSRVLTPTDVIVLCGSTRYKELFDSEMARLTLEGNVVIGLGLFGRAPDDSGKGKTQDHHVQIDEQAKNLLDQLHLRKIDLATRVHVINPEGYIGFSTSNEVHYAAWRGRKLTYYDESAQPDPSMFEHDFSDPTDRECTRFGCGAWDNLRDTR